MTKWTSRAWHRPADSQFCALSLLLPASYRQTPGASGSQCSCQKNGSNITLHFSAVGRFGPVAFFLTSLSLCGFCSEMTSALSVARVQGADGLGKENRGGTGETEAGWSSSQAHTASQWPSRARSPELSIYWQKCFFICKMGTILSTLRDGGN